MGEWKGDLTLQETLMSLWRMLTGTKFNKETIYYLLLVASYNFNYQFI